MLEALEDDGETGDDMYKVYLQQVDQLNTKQLHYDEVNAKLTELKQLKMELKSMLAPMEEQLQQLEEKVEEVLDEEKEVRICFGRVLSSGHSITDVI